MHLKALVALAAVVLSSSVPAMAAPPVPRGPEFRINANTRVSNFSPSIAAFPEGGFVVVWAGAGVNARFLDAEGRPKGGVVRLGGLTDVDQVVADRDGSFLVVWAGLPSGEAATAIYARRFNRDGTPRGNRIRVSLPSASNRYDAVATIGPDGRFAVAWKADIPIPGSEDGRYTNAVGRIFTAQGTPLTPEITLRAGSEPSPAGDDTIDALPSSLALRPDGTLAALVQENWACFQSYLVEVPPGGEPSAPQSLGSILCSNFIFNNLVAASLAMGKDGSLVATWSDYDIEAQRFAPDGKPRGDWFRLAQEQVSYQYEPHAALQAGGTFVIAWTEEDRDGDGYGIFGRAFAAIGTPRTQDFQINTTTEGNQYHPAIAAGRQGPAVVVWVQEPIPYGRSDIFARVLSPER
ncbi:MAG TPA: hypothetical protein VEW48_07900 [Thermoanaerobaculia bacterium]|nr:hypothetical protein [Thermoanaerobaculia bacterium]